MIYNTKKKSSKIVKAIFYSTLARKKKQVKRNIKIIKYFNLILKLKFTTYKTYIFLYKSISIYNNIKYNIFPVNGLY